jgi:hypothetical protein
VHVHRARRRHRVVASDVVQQVVARADEPAVLDEVPQQVELLGRQLDGPALARDLGAAEVDATSSAIANGFVM